MQNYKEDSWFTKLSLFLLREPKDQEQLISLLRDANERDLINDDALAMLEGVLQVSKMQVKDIMITRDKMVALNVNDSKETFLNTIITTGHSRFPVFNNNQEEVIGIAYAKDVLKLIVQNEPILLANLVRKAVIIPETKRLDILLKEFRINRYHMAIIVDEFGGVTGLVTIEDVLEQIVGDIKDEFDTREKTRKKKIDQTA